LSLTVNITTSVYFAIAVSQFSDYDEAITSYIGGVMAAVKKATVAVQSDIEKNKVMAVLAYIGILVLVPLLAAKDSPFARYHANQGLVLFLAEIVLGIFGNILSLSLALSGLWFLLMLMPLLWLATLVLAIIGIVNAVNGEMKPLPVIGGIKLFK
jgi:uncharacterized membrane protein